MAMFCSPTVRMENNFIGHGKVTLIIVELWDAYMLCHYFENGCVVVVWVKRDAAPSLPPPSGQLLRKLKTLVGILMGVVVVSVSLSNIGRGSSSRQQCWTISQTQCHIASTAPHGPHRHKHTWPSELGINKNILQDSLQWTFGYIVDKVVYLWRSACISV